MSTNGYDKIWVGGLKALKCHRAAQSCFFFLTLNSPVALLLSLSTLRWYKRRQIVNHFSNGAERAY